MTGASPARAWTAREIGALGLLLSVFISANLDKVLMSILIEPLKREFSLSDTQLGLLSGLAFSGAFTVAAIPFGRLADRKNRRNLLIIALAVWSLATLACGWTASLVQLLILRAIVGAGEAAGLPAVQSMLADIFPNARRATAMSIYYLGLPIAGFLAFATGPWLVASFGWRSAPVAFGAVGLVIAVLLMVALREPERTAEVSKPQGSNDAVPLPELIKFALGQRTLVHLSAAIVLNTFVTAGIGIWIMSFFVRTYQLNLIDAGLLVAVMQSVPKLFGTLLGGVITDRVAARDERGRLWVIAGTSLVTMPIIMAMASSPTIVGALIFVGLYGFFISFWYGPAYSMCHALLGGRMRATYLAVLLVLTNVLGLGLGPHFVGVVSDMFGSKSDPMSLRYAFIGIAMFLPWSALHFCLAARHLKADRARALLHGA